MANCQFEGGGINGALVVLSIVWIGILSGDTSSTEGILEGVRWETSVAAEVVEVTGAVDELLLRVSVETTILDQMGTLEASDSGEGPAGAAASLVLNWADTAMVLPVPGVGRSTVAASSDRGGAGSGRAVLLGVLLVIREVGVGGELFEVHCGELVQGLGESLIVLAIVLNHLVDILKESKHGVLVQLNWRDSVKLCNELLPEGLHIESLELFLPVEQLVIVFVDVGCGEGRQHARESCTEHIIISLLVLF